MPIDGKPKRHLRLKRLDNIRKQPRVCLLIDHYEDGNWGELWWVRIDAMARIVEPNTAVVKALQRKYPQYAAVPIHSIIRLEIETISTWLASDGTTRTMTPPPP